MMDTSKNLLGALYEPTDGYVDPAQTTQGHGAAGPGRRRHQSCGRSPVEAIAQDSLPASGA